MQIVYCTHDFVGFFNFIYSLQVRIVENDLRARQKDVEKTTTKLEELTSKWISLENDVKQVKIWTQKEAPVSIDLLKSSNASSEEKFRTNEQLQKELSTQISTVQKLGENFDSLTGRYCLQRRI